MLEMRSNGSVGACIKCANESLALGTTFNPLRGKLEGVVDGNEHPFVRDLHFASVVHAPSLCAWLRAQMPSH